MHRDKVQNQAKATHGVGGPDQGALGAKTVAGGLKGGVWGLIVFCVQIRRGSAGSFTLWESVEL